MTDPAARPAILFSAYPPHLFLASAYYYCWQLGMTHDVVLLVPEGAEANPGIKALLAHGRISRTVAMPSPRRPWALHRWASRTGPALLRETRPVAVFQSNFQYYFNKYLFRAAGNGRERPLRIAYLSGAAQQHLPIARGLREINESKIGGLVQRLPMVPKPVLRVLHGCRGELRHARDHVVFPLLLTGRPLAPTLHETRSRIVSRATGDLVDAFLCYGEGDRQALLEETDDAASIHLIEHPGTGAAEAMRALAPPSGTEAGAIVVLPSRCYDFGRLGQAGLAAEADRIAALWAAALNAVRSQIGPRAILWKLHPGRAGDPLMARMTEVVAGTVPGLTVVPPARWAEELICGAGAVIGDNSTTLSWAARAGVRPVYSLDLFDVPGGAEMERYPGITMVRSLHDLARLPALEPTPAPTRLPALPDVLQHLLQGRGATARPVQTRRAGAR